MAFVNVPPMLAANVAYAANNTYFSVQAFTLNTAGQKYAWVVQAPETGTITAVDMYFTTVTSGDVELRLEAVNDTATPGAPTGVLLGTNTNVTDTIAVAGWKTFTLTAGASVTRGQYIAVVLVQSSGARAVNDVNTMGLLHSYCLTYNGSAWAGRAGSGLAFLSYGGTYYPVSQHVGLPASFNVNTTTTPDEVGNLWTAPFGCKVIGVELYRNGAADNEVIIYDAANNVVISRTLDHNQRFVTTAGSGHFMFNAEVTLSAGAQYRIITKPSTSTNLAALSITAPSAAAMAQMPGRGQYQRTQRTDGGAWSETNTQEIFIYPIISAIDTGAGIAKLVGGGLVS